MAKLSASHRLEDVLDDLVVSLCKFTTLLNPFPLEEDPVIAFGGDTKARMATVAVFNIANKYGDFIRTGWRNILDCILRLQKVGLLPAQVANESVEKTNTTGENGFLWNTYLTCKMLLLFVSVCTICHGFGKCDLGGIWDLHSSLKFVYLP